MASIYKRGKTWWVKFYRNGKLHRQSLKTANKRVAEREAQAIEAELLEPWRNAPERKDPAVEDFWAEYEKWAYHHHKRKTIETQAQRWRVFMDWRKPKRLGDVTKRDAHEFKLALLADGKSKATVNCYLRDLQAIYSRAEKTLDLYNGINPFKGIERLKLEETPPPFLSEGEVRRLLTAAEQHSQEMHWFIALGVYAGLRYGEIGNCRWEYFDWKNKVLAIPSDEEFSLKSHKARTIPLSDKLAEILKPHASPTGFIFESGKPTRKKSHYRYDPRKSFNAVCKTAGLPDVTPHWLRYTFGSLLAQKGVSIYKVSKWMGHSSVKVTERHYAGLQAYDPEINSL